MMDNMEGMTFDVESEIDDESVSTLCSQLKVGNVGTMDLYGSV